MTSFDLRRRPESFTVAFAFGTRPEAIKLAPVIRAVEADRDLRARVLVTAQHRELLDQALRPFGIVPDVDLDLMRSGQTLSSLTQRVLAAMDPVLERERPDLVLVQGDTTTVFAATLAAFYRRIPVGHVEAGLRSFDLADPFPEEANRRLTAQLAALHFAPTRGAVENLVNEGVPVERVVLTGNTGIDALVAVVGSGALPPVPEPWRRLPAGARPVLLTLHRRESWGPRLEGICRAIRRATDELPALQILYPVHPQPRVRETVERLLAGHPRICLVEPLDYLQNVAAMRASSFVVTDSGGIQEEAPVLGRPVLVVREVTERPEAVTAGTSLVVGVDEDAVHKAIVALASDEGHYRAMARAVSPYGDGRASERVVNAIRRLAGLRERAVPPLVAERDVAPLRDGSAECGSGLRGAGMA